MKKEQETSTNPTQPKFKTYFDNNLVVMKDAKMFKVLFKLVSLHQLEYNKANKNNEPTDNIKFQYSLNELSRYTQISKAGLSNRLTHLEKLKLITKIKTKDDNNANGKNEYQLHINKLEEIVSKLNDIKVNKERVKYINEVFSIPQKEDNPNENESESESENNIQIKEIIPSTSIEDKKEMNKKLQELLKQGTGQFLCELDEEKLIEQNKAPKTIPTKKPTPTITEEIKMAQNKNVEVEEQSISVNSCQEYKKDNRQLKVIDVFSNDAKSRFSENFKNDKIFSRIIDCLNAKDYHFFMMNALSETGFYSISKEYLMKFDEKDRKILKGFIVSYQDYIENGNNKKVA